MVKPGKKNPKPREEEGYKLSREAGQDLQGAAKSYTKATGPGPDAFHPRVLLGLSDETCHKVADFLHVVEVIGKWPTAASCIFFFLLPTGVEKSGGGNGPQNVSGGGSSQSCCYDGCVGVSRIKNLLSRVQT